MKLYLKLCFLFGLIFLLKACLVPDTYYAALSLSNGAYSYDYVGDIHMTAVHMPEYIDRAGGNKDGLAKYIVKEFIRVIKERPQSSIKTAMMSPTVFKTQFLYVSPYAYPEATGMFKFKIDGDTLTVTSRAISVSDIEFLEKNNIPSKGLLCIKAFGTVLETNADRTATILNPCNEWDMQNLERSVKLVVKFPKPIKVDDVSLQ